MFLPVGMLGWLPERRFKLYLYLMGLTNTVLVEIFITSAERCCFHRRSRDDRGV